MTMRALDPNAILNVAGPAVPQPTHEGAATRPQALPVLLARQRAAFLRNGPRSLVERRANLKKLRSAVLTRKADLEAALDADFGHRSRHETAIMEILALTWGIDYLHKHLRRFMRREHRRVALPMRFARADIEYQPLGVVGIMAPWNYPLSLALMPLATALAAGNRALIKPSELTPATSDVLVKLVAETFAEDEVTVVTGDASIGAAFTALPFDHLFFTGSTAVGRAVMRAASEHLVPVTLELGGKSPALVDRGQSLDRVAADIAYGKLANAGQTCVAPDYALLHEGDVDRFVEAWGRAVASLYPQGPASEDYTSIVNVRHYSRLRGLLDDAQAKGARVVETGPSPEHAKGRAHTLPPTLVFNVHEDMRIMQEEIFGPVLPIVTYRDLDEAIAFVNARPRPLALYYFGSSATNRTRVLTRTTSGGVTINGTILHYVQDDLPFGGVGASGFGAYHGIEGFRTFSHQKAVFGVGRWNSSALLRPPFGRLTNMILAWMLRSGSTASQAAIEVRNEAVIHAPAERVWELLTDVERWPTWYRACRWVRVESPATALQPLVFRWKAHPVELRSTVVTTVRPHSFAITADAVGLHAERRFTVRPTPDGLSTVVVSHETQVGVLPRLGRVFLAPRLHAANQAMFDDLARAAVHVAVTPA
jgi:coniferyl-aldehyde dehydrogenase